MGISLKQLQKFQQHEFLTPRLYKRLQNKERFLSERLDLVKKLLQKPMQKGEE